MSITLTAGSGTPIPINTLNDLDNDLETVLTLGSEYVNYLAGHISAVPSDLKTNVQYSSGNQQWKLGPAATPVTFTLSGGVTGNLSIVNSGTIFSYTNSFPTEVTLNLSTTDQSNQASKSVPASPGSVYLCVELDFTIQGGVSISYQQGIYGLTGSVNSSNTFQIMFYKQCKPDDNFGQSVAKAFGDLVLPFHPDTVNHLQPGDFLRHTADSNLQLGLGASVGFKLFSYANQWTSGIPGIANSPTLTTGIKPNAQAAVKLAYSFGYDATFDQILWKESNTVAHLHLYRSKVQNRSLDLTAGITAQLNATASTAVVQGQVASAANNAAQPSDLQDGLNQVFSAFSNQTAKVSSDINSKITTLLKPINNTQQITLDAKISQVNDNYLLVNFTVDLTNPAWTQSWTSMCNGRYQDAIEESAGAVQLDPGSGLELLYSRTASLTLNFFGQWNGLWTKSTISNSSLIYAGNNTFHLITADGMQRLAKVNNSSTEVDVYFSSEVDLSGAPVAGEPNFNIMLRAVNNPKFGSYIAQFVGVLTSGQNGGDTVRSQIQTMANQGNSTQVLQLVFKAASCTQLQFSPAPTPQDQAQADSNNYSAFAWACMQIMDPGWGQLTDDRGRNLSYGDWSNWNRALISSAGQPLADNSDRTESGPLSGAVVTTFVEQNWPGIPAAMVSYPFQASSEFMNLCEDLQKLSTATVTQGPNSWQAFAQDLVGVINRDVSWDFVAPTALALAKLMAQASPQSTVGPAPGLAGDSSIAYTMTFS
jgi:hypothetical protein